MPLRPIIQPALPACPKIPDPGEKCGLAESLAAPTKKNVPAVVVNAVRAQIRELMAELQHDLDEYERL